MARVGDPEPMGRVEGEHPVNDRHHSTAAVASVSGRATLKRVLFGLGALMLAVVAIGGVLLWQTDGPGPATVDDALGRFDEGDPSAAVPEGTRPPEGVYRYTGDGTERLSFPPVSQRYGDVVPGTVTHEDDGCWVFRLDFNAAHWQDWRLCPADGRIGDAGGSTHQAWDLGVTSVTSLSTFTCDPPGPMFPPPEEPGWTVDQECSGTSDQVDGTATSAGPWRYVGPERLTVGDESLDTWRFHQERTITGAQTGTEVAELWFAHDGLLVRLERTVEVDSPSPVGDVTYSETGTVELTDLDPRT